MRFEVLGPVAAIDPDGPVALPRGRSRVVLAWYLLHANRAVADARTLAACWPGVEHATGRRWLRTAIRQLHTSLGDAAPTLDGDRHLLAVDEQDVDAHRFEELADAGFAALDRGDLDSSRRALTDALALWHGEPYAELEDVLAALPEAQRLRQRRLDAVEALVSVDLHGAVSYRVIADLEALVHRHPERERLWRLLAVALYRCGRQVEAVRACGRARAAMIELGAAPSAPLVDLERAVLAQDPSLLESAVVARSMRR